MSNATLMEAIHEHVESHKTAGHAWPADAQFAAVYRHATWPFSWGDSYIRFFANEAELHAWLAHKYRWSLYQGNRFAYQGYEWDLGPKLRPDLSVWEGNIHSGPAKLY